MHKLSYKFLYSYRCYFASYKFQLGSIRITNLVNVSLRVLDFDVLQTTGSKGESDTEQPAKRTKVGIAVDVAKASTPSSSDASPVIISPNAGKTPDKNKSGEKPVSHSPKTNTTVVLPESMSSKQHPVRPFAPVGSPFMVNRFKLDNRPTAFKILPPLPAGFTNVSFSLSFPPKNSHVTFKFLWPCNIFWLGSVLNYSHLVCLLLLYIYVDVR